MAGLRRLVLSASSTLTCLVGLSWPTDPALAADRMVSLQANIPISEGVASLPSIAEPVDDAERRINVALRRLDAAVRKAAGECRTQGGSKGNWSRSVEVPMRGPGFISFVMTDNLTCGGAHPVIGTMAIVYDLRTGAPVDWARLLPRPLVGTLNLQGGLDGTRMVTMSSARLYTLYLHTYDLGRGGKDDEECRAAVRDAGETGPPAMMAWLDAKDGGLVVQFDLPHVVAACADPVVIPMATLQTEGASAFLLDSLAAARRLQRPTNPAPNSPAQTPPNLDAAVAVIREALARDLSPILIANDKKDDDQRFLSRDLFERFHRAQTASDDQYDADPYTGVQDTTDLKVTRVSGRALDASSAEVTALIDVPGRPSLKVVYRMIPEDGRWKIDDITSSNDGQSLRAALAPRKG